MIHTTEQMRNALAAQVDKFGLQYQCGCDGSFLSEIAVIAEAPGDREVESKRPLVGGSGMALWSTLRPFGIVRDKVYITNVAKRQVSFGNDRRNPISRNELDHWTGILQWELQQLPNLRYILVLGNMALKAITGREGITDWRGSVLDTQLDGPTQTSRREVRTVCTYNPAAVLREPKLALTFKYDCAKLKQVIEGKWQIIPVQTHINPSFSDAMDWIGKMEKEDKPVAYDIEVISNETACIGLCNDSVEAMCINFRSRETNRYNIEHERRLRRRMQSFLGSRECQLVAQNGMFDASWLAFKDRIVVAPHYFDTMLAHHCLYPQLPHNLGYITTQYTTRPFYKNERTEWREGGDIDTFWRYNGQDCCNTHAASSAMLSELRQQQLEQFFFSHIMRLQHHLIRMTVGGVLVDTEYQKRLQTELELEVSRLREAFHDAVHVATNDNDYNPNPMSPRDMSELLFTKLKLVGRGVSTDKENRARMYAHAATTEPKRAVLRSLDSYLKEHKFYSTYAMMSTDDDNRARCEYKQTGVQSAPGRLSSASTLWGSGTNLQNQPERAYGMFIADKGYSLGYFDLSQAEARLVGWYANIETWIVQFERARFDRSYDAHRALASEMFGVPYNEVPTFDRDDDGIPTIRYVAKRCRHGLNYRMGPERLAAVTGLTLADATNAYRVYHRTTPELQRWWHDLETEVKQNRSLYNALGRRFVILERMTSEALESIVAFKPQSTNGDHVSRVIYLSHDDPRWPSNARILLNIHDALVCLGPRHKIQLCLSIMKKYAEQPILIPYRDKTMTKYRELIIPADTKMSREDASGVHRWSQLKKVDIEAAR